MKLSCLIPIALSSYFSFPNFQNGFIGMKNINLQTHLSIPVCVCPSLSLSSSSIYPPLSFSLSLPSKFSLHLHPSLYFNLPSFPPFLPLCCHVPLRVPIAPSCVNAVGNTTSVEGDRFMLRLSDDIHAIIKPHATIPKIRIIKSQRQEILFNAVPCGWVNKPDETSIQEE